MHTLELVHTGGTRCTVEVLGCDPFVPKLIVKWETPGEPYMFDLRKNRLMLNRAKKSQWSTPDMRAAIDLWVFLKNRMRYLQRDMVTGSGIRPSVSK